LATSTYGKPGVDFLVRVIYQERKIMVGAITASPFDIHGLPPSVSRKINLAPRWFSTKSGGKTDSPIHTL
jgi:hypothetical protein